MTQKKAALEDTKSDAADSDAYSALEEREAELDGETSDRMADMGSVLLRTATALIRWLVRPDFRSVSTEVRLRLREENGDLCKPSIASDSRVAAPWNMHGPAYENCCSSHIIVGSG